MPKTFQIVKRADHGADLSLLRREHCTFGGDTLRVEYQALPAIVEHVSAGPDGAERGDVTETVSRVEFADAGTLLRREVRSDDGELIHVAYARAEQIERVDGAAAVAGPGPRRSRTWREILDDLLPPTSPPSPAGVA